MVWFYFAFFCVFLGSGESLPNNQAVKIVDLYNTDLAYFKDFLSSSNVENLQYSKENIEYGKIALVREAADSYAFLKGEIIRWCSYVNNAATSAGYNVQNLARNGQKLSDQTTLYLNEMKNKFNQIAIGQQLNWDPNFEAIIKMTDNVLQLEIISGSVPKGVNWNNFFAEAKKNGHAEMVSPFTFDSNINQAIGIIEGVLNDISQTTKTYEDLHPREISEQCSPILNSLPNAKASTSSHLHQRGMNRNMPNQIRNHPSPYHNFNSANGNPANNPQPFSY